MDVSELSFITCVHSFTSSVLTNAETKCITNTATKFMAATQRASQRFLDVQSDAILDQIKLAEERVAELQKTAQSIQAPPTKRAA